MSDTPQYCVECERLSRERDGLLNGNRDLHEECQRLRAQVERMRPVVEAAKWWRDETWGTRCDCGHCDELVFEPNCEACGQYHHPDACEYHGFLRGRAAGELGAAYRAANGDKA